MKVLDAGTDTMSNIDVLKWMKEKREQHAKEDAEDKRAGLPKQKRPQNFMKALDKHEKELKSKKYPYTKNPKAYSGYEAMELFDNRVIDEIIEPLGEKYRGNGHTEEELENTLGKEQEEKSLTETELLTIMNHAPKNVEMLKPMIENVEERYTQEELEKIVDCVWEVYRYNEERPLEEEEAGEDAGLEGEMAV